MFETLAKVSTPIIIFLLGYLLKRLNLLKKEDGDLFLRLVFYIVMPALYLLSIPSIKLVPSLFYLPLLVPVVIFTTFFVSWIVAKALGLQKTSFGVFLVATMIMNTGFLLPFFIATYGNAGLVRLSLVDATNGLLTFSFVYFIAAKYGAGKTSTKLLVQKVLLAPPIWATVVGLVLNFSGFRLPLIATNFLQAIGNLATPLIMLALGSYFTLKVVRIWEVLPALFIRFGFGLMLGLIFSAIFHLEGMTKIVVILCAGAPIGYNTLTFSSLEKLDIEYAASIVSASMLLSIVIVPILFVLIK
ncbi:MAG TPA: AEC family transporter [Candidatus Sulfotelmatobacter sp.]|nr:AEC family transporter [Candidatus Sulfotelmatobacter sp.]